MPIFVPIIIGGAAAATGLSGVIMGVRSGLKVRSDRKQYEERVQQYNAKEAETQKAFDALQQHLAKLGEARLEAIMSLRHVAEYLRKAKLKDRELNPDDLKFVQEELAAWEIRYFEPLKIGYGVVVSTVTGAGTAALANTLAMSIGLASTGTAISTLSGAAATNATLAWLGGGALAAGGGGMALGTLVLGGITVGPALMVSGILFNKKAIETRTELEALIAAMDVAEAKMDHKQAEFVITHTRIDELMEALQEGSNAVHQMTDTLIENHPDGDAPIEDIFNLVRTAKSLATLIDIRLLDDDGQLLNEDEDDKS